MIKQLILVGLGGAIGSVLRFLTSVLVAKYWSGLFPLATFGVNVVGCFVIGLLLGLLEQRAVLDDRLRLLLITGFCGGFTTFSAFASENINLLQHHHYGFAILYIVVSVLLGLLALWLGATLTR